MIPVELITMGVSGVMGAVIKLMGQAQRHKAEQRKLEQKMLLQRFQATEDSINAAAERVGEDMFSKITRRGIVVAVLGIAYWQYMGGLTGLDIVMPVFITENTSFLGLFEWTKTYTEYMTFSNAIVIQDWIRHSILAIISFYFGSSAAKAQ